MEATCHKMINQNQTFHSNDSADFSGHCRTWLQPNAEIIHGEQFRSEFQTRLKLFFQTWLDSLEAGKICGTHFAQLKKTFY